MQLVQFLQVPNLTMDKKTYILVSIHIYFIILVIQAEMAFHLDCTKLLNWQLPLKH